YSVARSRSGTGAEFTDMVTRCKTAGVDIIVDAVINHMTNYPSPGVGSNGTSYSKYDYPGLYAPSDFHPACTVNNYQNAANVQDCELFSLPDLNTGLAAVWGLIPSDKAVVFLQNHDTQHNCGISYRNGGVFRIANVWMLAQPYGYPSILSSYAFDCPTGNSMGPPSDANGWTLNVTCAS